MLNIKKISIFRQTTFNIQKISFFCKPHITFYRANFIFVQATFNIFQSKFHNATFILLQAMFNLLQSKFNFYASHTYHFTEQILYCCNLHLTFYKVNFIFMKATFNILQSKFPFYESHI